jgi:GNAT superfamily N-acetyltransferase
MIRECNENDFEFIYSIVNDAATAYAGFIPSDCYHQPYMTHSELSAEMKRMTFYGWEDAAGLKGVMASEPVRDITLVRHAYVLPGWQGRGVGRSLLNHILSHRKTRRILVGTWAGATWAVAFYERHGFVLQTDKDRLLKQYWQISQRQIDTSVVLELESK